jgi:elongator complex protein 1
MSSHQLPLLPSSSPSIPVHAAFSGAEDILVLIWESACVQVWDLKTRTGSGRGELMDPNKVWEGFIDDSISVSYRRISVASEGVDKITIAALGSRDTGFDVLVLVVVVAGKVESKRDIKLPGRNGNLVEDALYTWQDLSGQLFNGKYRNNMLDFELTLYSLAVDSAGINVTQVSKFPVYCTTTRSITTPNCPGTLFVGLTQRGNLYVSSSSGACRIIATNANSLTIASGYLVYTTMAHEAQFAPIGALWTLLYSDDTKEQTWETEKRRMERGSRIVTAVPSNMCLILQMPRGNLESINPRPLVLEVVRRNIDK